MNCDFSRVHSEIRQTKGSATRSEVYTARFRRAKRLQLERQVMFEILHGGRIHRRIRSGRLRRFSLGDENDRSCSFGNPNQRPETRVFGIEESDDGDTSINQR